MSDSENVAERGGLWVANVCTNSGDKKSMMTSPLVVVLYLPNWPTGMILKATRPRDVICRLFGVTSGRMRLVDGVSAKEKNENGNWWSVVININAVYDMN